MAAKTSQSRRKPAAPQITNTRFLKGSRPLGEIADPFIQHCCAKYGFNDIRLFRDWAQVAGPHLASRCRPVKIVPHGKYGRVLHLLSPGGFATEVAHSSAAIVDRINAVYGFCAVDKIRVTQTGAFEPLVPPPPPPPPPPATPQEVSAVETLVEKVQDPALRAALRNFGITLKVTDRHRAEQEKELLE